MNIKGSKLSFTDKITMMELLYPSKNRAAESELVVGTLEDRAELSRQCLGSPENRAAESKLVVGTPEDRAAAGVPIIGTVGQRAENSRIFWNFIRGN